MENVLSNHPGSPCHHPCSVQRGLQIVYSATHYTEFQITANNMQRFLNLFIFTDALHISGGSSAHHQEHIAVHNIQVLSTSTAASCYRGRNGTNEYHKQYTDFTTTSFPAEYHII
jgi:hypothetical protein